MRHMRSRSLRSFFWSTGASSVLGRMFDFGTVTILGTGEGFEAVETIAGPMKLRNSIITGT